MDRPLRILLLADYPAGVEIAKYFKSLNENIVGYVKPDIKNKNRINKDCSQKILNILQLPKNNIFEEAGLVKKTTLLKIKQLNPDLVISIFWNSLLNQDFLKLPRLGAINLHLSYLPFNRGRNPNVWPIIDQTQAGVTIHFIDEKADSGDIIFQSEVTVETTDTGESLYKKLVRESIKLFKHRWKNIKTGNYNRIPQTKHFKAHTRNDLQLIDEIQLEKKYTALELINILRARTFPPFPAAYFINEKGEKLYVRIAIEKESHE